MAKLIVPLTELQVKNAKPKDKPYKMLDGGLFVEVMPSGSRIWRWKFRQANGKENALTLGDWSPLRQRPLGSRSGATRACDAGRQ